MKRMFPAGLFLLCTVVQAQTASRPVRAGAVPPNVPFAGTDANFPLRVHLLTARWGGLSGVYHGYGSGNLLEAGGPRGFDYGFECDVPFGENRTPADTYQARWKESPYQLEILTSELGSAGAGHLCTLRLAMKERPFEPADTAALSHGVSSSLHKRWQDPDFAYEERALDYPLHFHAVDGQRQEDGDLDHGWGTANLSDPADHSVKGAEYTYNCSAGFLTNSQIRGFYQARWINPGTELEVLLQRPASDKVDKCTVEVSLRPQAFPESHHISLAAPTGTQVNSASTIR